jgi:hypothetical protein
VRALEEVEHGDRRGDEAAGEDGVRYDEVAAPPVARGRGLVLRHAAAAAELDRRPSGGQVVSGK